LSRLVRLRLRRLNIETTHEERLIIDELAVQRTGERDCDEAVKKLTDEEFLELVHLAKAMARERKKLIMYETR
jgi:DNA integrity scanning protein DisA with diadenylate cyclase activity